MLNWIGTRGRTYEQVMAGDALRGMYLTHRLHLHPTKITEDLFRRFDYHYSKLSPDEQEKRRNYWTKKTEGLPGAVQILKKYGVTAI